MLVESTSLKIDRLSLNWFLTKVFHTCFIQLDCSGFDLKQNISLINLNRDVLLRLRVSQPISLFLHTSFCHYATISSPLRVAIEDLLLVEQEVDLSWQAVAYSVCPHPSSQFPYRER